MDKYTLFLIGFVLFGLSLAYSVLNTVGQAEQQTGGLVCTDSETGASMGFADALAIAEASSCAAEGELENVYQCNSVTGTWWIELNAEAPGCNPACVIDVNTGAAEVNWRCTGLLP